MARRVPAYLGKKCFSRFGLERRGVNRAAAEGAARALLADGGESLLTTVCRRVHAHRAVMLPGAPATCRQVCLCVGGEQRRHQRKAEEH